MKVFILILVFAPPTFQEKVVTREMPNWRIQGRQYNVAGQTIEEYLGIPYAKPPTGELRYKKPEPYQQYPPILNAFNYSSTCHQIRSIVEDYIEEDNDVFEEEKMSEDCLYLNVWAPTHPKDQGKDVMVWIHGGGWVFGSGSYFLYNGSMLAALHNDVVVTFNYRLGSFGFLVMNNSDVSGNAGLYDQNLALQWVQKYIRYFGGQPKRVTLFGESAGGLSIGFHLTSKFSKGLFHRAIIESGIPNTPYVVNHKCRVLNFTLQFAALIGCRDDDTPTSERSRKVLECLRSKPASELARADYLLRKKNKIWSQFFPIVEEEFLDYVSLSPFVPKVYNDHEIIIGVNKDEFASLFFFVFPEIFRPENSKLSKQETVDLLNYFLQNNLEIPDAHKKINTYFKDVPPSNLTAINERMSDILTDLFFKCPTLIFADKYSSRGNKVYFYYFTHASRNIYFQLMYGNWSGAFHFDETQYVFGSPYFLQNYNYTDSEKRFSKNIMALWASFGKNGIPHSKRYYYWPPFPKTLELNADHVRILDRLPQDKVCQGIWYKYLEHRAPSCRGNDDSLWP